MYLHVSPFKKAALEEEEKVEWMEDNRSRGMMYKLQEKERSKELSFYASANLMFNCVVLYNNSYLDILEYTRIVSMSQN